MAHNPASEVVQAVSPSSPRAQRTALLPLPPKILAQGRESILFRWIASRALTLAVMALLQEGDVSGDVSYYARSLYPLFRGGSIHFTLQEYPVSVLGLMAPQYLLGARDAVAFTFLFALSMLAVDAVFTGFLWRGDGRKRGDATNLWLWFVPMIGPLAYFRFDLVPAVLAGGAVLAAIQRPAIAGALTAIGAAIKLWPVAMLPTFLIRRGDRRAVLLGFLGAGVAVGAASLLIGGVARNESPLYWQSSRGLQIESVTATPLMLARMFNHHTWILGISKYKSWEVFGPAVPDYVTATTVFTAIGGAALVLLWWRAHRSGSVSAETLGWIFIATTLVVTITNKALSPQYLLWLGGPTAALAVRAPADHAVRLFGRMLLITALCTQLIYPIGYQQLTQLRAQMPVWTIVLATRNALLVWLTYYAVRQVWNRTRRSPAAAAPPAR